MADFGEWFEINKVTSDKSSDMDPLKDLFEKCWNDSQKECLKNLENEYEPDEDDISDLESYVAELESYVAELENDVDNLQDIVRKLKKG